MPGNTGTPPEAELVDVRFRNGSIARGVKPSAYRWTLDDRHFGKGYAYDIASWQPAKR